jgi:hypothetical protein
MELSNPLLLSVKMFLADVRSWRLNYKFPNYVCTDFAKLIFDAATVQGMRCGYALVYFEGSRTSHAIVAFETDYGLIYVEPQTGEVEHIKVGIPYPTQLEGVPRDCTVSSIDVMWNDEHPLKFIKCPDCGYLFPICCPVCGHDNVSFSED